MSKARRGFVERCPGCGELVTQRSYHRLGWYYTRGCGRRYHPETKEWEAWEPRRCLLRQRDKQRLETAKLRTALRVQSREAAETKKHPRAPKWVAVGRRRLSSRQRRFLDVFVASGMVAQSVRLAGYAGKRAADFVGTGMKLLADKRLRKLVRQSILASDVLGPLQKLLAFPEVEEIVLHRRFAGGVEWVDGLLKRTDDWESVRGGPAIGVAVVIRRLMGLVGRGKH